MRHLYSSNRASIAESYCPIISEYARRRGGYEAALPANDACNASGGVGGMPGAVHFTVKIAPGGLASSGADNIHSNALYTCLNFISEVDFSENTMALAQSYPLVRAVAAWWVGDGTGGCAGWLTKELLPGTKQQCKDLGTPFTRNLHVPNV